MMIARASDSAAALKAGESGVDAFLDRLLGSVRLSLSAGHR
jgi:hypothetical protein